MHLVLDLFWRIKESWDNGLPAADAALEEMCLHALDAFKTSPTAAHDSLMCMNILTRSRHFDVESLSCKAFASFCGETLKTYPTDVFVLERVCTILASIRADTYCLGILHTILGSRHLSRPLQSSVLALLCPVVEANLNTMPADMPEAIRQYLLFTMKAHGEVLQLCELACTILLLLRPRGVILDLDLLDCLLSMMEAHHSAPVIALAGSYFICKALPTWLMQGHTNAVLRVLTTFSEDCTITCQAIEALEACMCLCAGGMKCVCNTVRAAAVDTMAAYRREVSVQRSGCIMLSKMCTWECTSSMDASLLAAVVHSAYLAMEMYSEDSNIQLGGCKIMFKCLPTDMKTLPSFFQHTYMTPILSAVLHQQACAPFLKAAFPCLRSYYALLDWDVHCDHEAISRCIQITIEAQGQHGDVAVQIAVLFLLGVCLKHVSTRLQARLYSPVMLLLWDRPQLGNVPHCIVASHVMMLWAKTTDINCKEVLEASLVLLQCHLDEKEIHFTSVSTIRSVLHYLPTTVSMADRILTLFGAVIRNRKDLPAILLCVDSMHILFAKCPKFSKRFIHSVAFRAVVSLSKNPKNDAYLMATCRDLILSVSTKYPGLNSL